MISDSHGVCKKGFYVAIISTTKEKDDIKSDLKIAFDLIGETKHEFLIEEDMYESTGYKDDIYVTSTLDCTSHFENAAKDVEKIYEVMTGNQLDLTMPEKEKEK